jgi:hypothetical protein
MQDSIEILAADSLAASLSAATFTGDYTTVSAVRAYTPEFEGADMDTIKVSVIPGNVDVTQVTRVADLFEFELHVCLAKRFATTAELDGLVHLRTQILDKIRSNALPASSPAMPTGTNWFSIANNVTFDRDTIMNQSVFLADIAVTYRRAQDKVTA